MSKQSIQVKDWIVHSATLQVEQLLAANDALGAENVARSERIAHLEDVLAR
jgi:hypothetical protein